MGVLPDRLDQPGGRAVEEWLVAVRALLERPPEVVAATDGPRQEVDLLPLRLADVAEPEVARLAIEAPAPRIADAELPDLFAPAGAVDVGIVARDRVRRSRVDVDAQDLAEQRCAVLSVTQRVAADVSVAQGDVELPVRPEADLPDVQHGDRA